MNVQGVVTRISDNGFQINNRGTWYNLSKRDVGMPLPRRGESINIDYDSWIPPDGGTPRLYIERWTPRADNRTLRALNGGLPNGDIDAFDTHIEAVDDVPTRDIDAYKAMLVSRLEPTLSVENAPQEPQEASQWLRDDKPVVTRLACLNSAIACLPHIDPTSREDTTTEEFVLGLAERFVTWATWGGGKEPA